MAKKLPVPYVEQLEGYCGPACLEMVLGYYGIKKSQEEIGEKLKVHPMVGCTPLHLCDYAESLGLHATINEHTEIDDLIANIDNHIPTIVLQSLYLEYKSEGHYRIVIGYQQENTTAAKILFHDPQLGKQMHLYYKMFDFLWNNGNRIAIEIKK